MLDILKEKVLKMMDEELDKSHLDEAETLANIYRLLNFNQNNDYLRDTLLGG